MAKGIPANIKNSIIGKYTAKNNILDKDRILYCDKLPLIRFGINAFIVTKDIKLRTKIPVIHIDKKPLLNEGDVINIDPDGNISIVWDINSEHNAFYVTDLCNSKCIMCPQVEADVSRYKQCAEILKYIKLNPDHTIGITGGEPAIEIDKLAAFLSLIAKKSPNQRVHILTNGRNFKNPEYVQKIISAGKLRLSFGIPLFSDIAEEHDYITGQDGAFQQTLKGLYNLARYYQQIEIRTVIMKQNYKGLKALAKYIYRNLPFVSHVALMGMEYHGRAEDNYEIVKIDPVEYKKELYEAVREFVRCNLAVDIYNIPYCLTDNRLEKFCRDSISSWKKEFLPQCGQCIKKSGCCGIFATSFIQSKNIKPIKSKHRKPMENTPSGLLVKYIDLVKNATGENDIILDLACGYGRNAIYAAKMGLNVVGIDNCRDSTDYINSLNIKNIVTKILI